MPTIKYPIPEAAAARTHCDAIAANAAVLKTVITGDPTSDTAATAISAIRHSLDEQNGHCTGDITEQVIREMFTALVNTGKIDKGETKHGPAYRTAPQRRT